MASTVGAAFSDVTCTSAYDMATALKAVEDSQTFLTAEYNAYVRRAMHLFRQKMREAKIDVKDEHYIFLHNFRVAKSWTEVVSAFMELTPRHHVFIDRKMRRMMMVMMAKSVLRDDDDNGSQRESARGQQDDGEEECKPDTMSPEVSLPSSHAPE